MDLLSDMHPLNDVAKVLGVSRSTANKWRKQGLRAARLGNQFWVFGDDLENFFRAMASGGKAPNE